MQTRTMHRTRKEIGDSIDQDARMSHVSHADKRRLYYSDINICRKSIRIHIHSSIQHGQLYLRWERNRVWRLRLALFRGGKQSGSGAAPYPQENGTAERRTNLHRGRTHRPSGIPEHRARPTSGPIQRGRLAGSAGPRSVPAAPAYYDLLDNENSGCCKLIRNRSSEKVGNIA